MSDSTRVIVARALRGWADGLVSVLLAGYLTRLGFGPVEVGAIVTGTLVGSAAVTTAVGLAGGDVARRTVLLAAAVLMAGTGVGFAALRAFWPLFAVAVVGTLNPSGGDVSVFLPVEQAVLAETTRGAARTGRFATYNVAGAFAAGIGALLSGLPEIVARRAAVDPLVAERLAFLAYALIGCVVGGLYIGLSPAIEHRPRERRAPLARSRRVVLELSALFSLDSFGGGFVVQSLLVLWLYRRFGLSVETAGAVFFAVGLLGAGSQLVSARLAVRIGLVRTMVYTHLPANVFLALAGVVPSAPAAVGLLLLRAALSQMDVPARQAYVMALVPPEERMAAASVTNVPRSLATALAPVLTGLMLARSSFGWPLVCAGVLKATYDVVLLVRFVGVEVPVD